MPLDFFTDDRRPDLHSEIRRARGYGSHHAGLAAEELVARHYQKRGLPLAARRWRSKRGEIDLILDGTDCQIFVEVKSSSSHHLAAGHMTRSQILRLYDAADDYIEARHGHQNIDRRFDLALVDRQGRLDLIENAFML